MDLVAVTRTLTGKEFHARGPATEKALSLRRKTQLLTHTALFVHLKRDKDHRSYLSTEVPDVCRWVLEPSSDWFSTTKSSSTWGASLSYWLPVWNHNKVTTNSIDSSKRQPQQIKLITCTNWRHNQDVDNCHQKTALYLIYWWICAIQ